MASRLVRASAVTVNDVLDGHKLLEIDCVDRVYLTLSVPSLVVGGQVVNFLTDHEHNPIPSPALLERRGQAFRRALAGCRTYSSAECTPVAGEVVGAGMERAIRTTPRLRQTAPPQSSTGQTKLDAALGQVSSIT